MFCKSCFTNLARSTNTMRCPGCNRKFDPANPSTYYPRPFPSKLKITGQILFTTLLGVVCAFAVAFFQMVRSSGH